MSVYLDDTLADFPGTLLTSHASTPVGTWTWPNNATHVAGSAAITLDGAGFCFNSGGAGAQISSASLPSSPNFQVFFSTDSISPVGTIAGILLFADISGGVLNHSVSYAFDRTHGRCFFYQDGSAISTNGEAQSDGTVVYRRVDVITAGSTTTLTSYYSTTSITGPWTLDLTGTSLFTPSYPIAVGPYFALGATTTTTGPHVGNIIYQDSPPSVDVGIGQIASSGEHVQFQFNRISDGALAYASALITAPVLFKNGTNIGPLWDFYISGFHNRILAKVPIGVSFAPGDTASLTAPISWMQTTLGNVAALAPLNLLNNTGKSCYGTDPSAPRPFRPGFNMDAVGIAINTPYQIFKNFRFRLQTQGFFSALDAGGYPTTIFNQPQDFPFASFAADPNSVDTTTYAGFQAGLWAIQYDDLAPISSPTTLDIVSGDGTKSTAAIQSAYTNPGINGVGICKVYNCQRVGGSGVADMPLSLRVSNAAKAPQFANLAIYGPNDFTPTIPQTLDTSNPYAVCSRFLKRFPNGAGSLRWNGAMWSFLSGVCTITESWQDHQLSDFTWNGNFQSRTIGYTLAEAFTTGAQPWFYGSELGTPYPIIMTSNITTAPAAGSFTTITYTLDSSNPVLAGQILAMPSGENCRVRSTDGAGNAVIERGSWWNGAPSTPATQTAGSIPCYARHASSLSILPSGVFQLVHFHTQAPHGLTTGLKGATDGTFPTLNFADGSSWNPTGNGQTAANPCYVTGPNTLLAYWTTGTGGGGIPTTISGGSIGLNPATAIATLAFPPEGVPWEAACLATGAITPVPDVHFNVPALGTDGYFAAAAAKIKANRAPGGQIILEGQNEEWDDPSSWWTAAQCGAFDSIFGNPLHTYFLTRVQRCYNIFQTVFGSRASEIKVSVSIQFGNTGIEYLTIAQSLGLPIHYYSVAPYQIVMQGQDFSALTPIIMRCDIPQTIDHTLNDILCSDATNFSYNHSVALAQHEIMTYNNANPGIGCQLYAYEGDIQEATPQDPVNINYRAAMNHDVVHDPLFYIAQWDLFAAYQRDGFARFNIQGWSSFYNYFATWPVWAAPEQVQGKGDGSDGLLDNRVTMCSVGLVSPYVTKSTLVNQDDNSVSVRGLAVNDWLGTEASGKTLVFPVRSR